MKKIIIKFEKEIEHCYECPFTERVWEQGFSGTCCKFNYYITIPKQGVLESCPFLKEEDKNI